MKQEFISQFPKNKEDSRIHLKDEKYSTSDIIGLKIIDTNVTGMPYYQEFLHNKNYDDLHATIELMSPNEYYDSVSKNSLVRGKQFFIEYLKEERRSHTNIINDIKQALLKSNKQLCMPILDFYHKKQEGLHRMLVIGDLYGWDFKVPVLVIKDKNT